jgi:hypothetical protein
VDLEKEKEARVPDRMQVTVLTYTSGHLAEGCAASSAGLHCCDWTPARRDLRAEKERGPNARARQVTDDLTRSVTVHARKNSYWTQSDAGGSLSPVI